MSVVALLLVAAGIPLLYYGAEWLVDNSVELGRRARLTPLLIGVTIVAFGTSAPELVVSVTASTASQPEVAIGNVLGSNIVNIGVVLAAGALLAPLAVRAHLLRQSAVALGGGSGLFALLAWDGSISRLEGVLLVAFLVGFVYFAYREARRGGPDAPEARLEVEPALAQRPGLLVVLGIAAGLILLVVGARALVTGAVELAIDAGVSTRVVGLTVVAIGTSLPELATIVVASGRRQTEVAVGNVVGSNMFNLAWIIGASAIVAPLPVPYASWLDFAVMLAFTGVMLLFSRTGRVLTRAEGAALLGGYVAYAGWLVFF